MNRENSCKLDGLRTVGKPKQKFYMKGSLAIACNTFLQRGRIFPTSVASFSVTKSILLSQTTNVRLFSNCVRTITTRHRGPLEPRVTRVYFSRETKRNENSPQTSDFYHFNRSSADTKLRTRSHDLWRVTGNRSHA